MRHALEDVRDMHGNKYGASYGMMYKTFKRHVWQNVGCKYGIMDKTYLARCLGMYGKMYGAYMA